MPNDKDFKVKKGVKPTVYHEKLGTVASGTEYYSLAGASYDSVSFSVAAQDGTPSDIFFKPDGTKMYILGFNNDSVYEYNLSTAWNISTTSYMQSFSVTTQEANPRGVFFKPDGLKMYIVGGTGDAVYEYNLSTAWNISTASYVQNFSVAAQDGAPMGVFFKSDGTKMYVVGGAGQDINEYNLSTAWNVSTASYVQVFSVAPQDNSPYGLFFKDDGTNMYVVGTTGDAVYEYNLSTAWNISTASYTRSFSPAIQETSPTSLFFKPDGTKMYVVGSTTDTVYQYSTTINSRTLDLSTGSVFQLTPTSNIQLNLSNPAASGTVSGATLLLKPSPSVVYDVASSQYIALKDPISSAFSSAFSLRFNENGTKLYIGGWNGSSYGISELNVLVPWDITSVNTTSVAYYNSSGANNILDFFFKPDGTKLYVMGYTDDLVTQHTLSTPWDISTASSDGVSKNVAAQDTTPHSIFFKPDGTKFWMSGNSTVLNEYSMSTPWAVNTANYVGASGSLTGSTQYGIAFIPDGTKVYMMGASGVLYGYNLSTAWNATTLNTTPFMSFNAQAAAAGNRPYALVFGNDGLYWYGIDQDEVIQFSSYQMPTITYDSSIDFPGNIAPTSPALGQTDVLVFSTRDGGANYNAALAIDGAS